MLGFAVPRFKESAFQYVGALARFASTAKLLGAGGTTVDQVADTVVLLADNGYPDAFVDLMSVAAGSNAYLRWVERLLTR